MSNDNDFAIMPDREADLRRDPVTGKIIGAYFEGNPGVRYFGYWVCPNDHMYGCQCDDPRNPPRSAG